MRAGGPRSQRHSVAAAPVPATDDPASAAPTSFYWYDLETTGTHPPSDRIVEFAGQRTDADLRPVGAPFRTRIRLAPDVLPSVEACLVTGITPSEWAAGVDEWQALHRIEEEMLRPGTCVVGYNNLRFDDEFLRHGFYRNLIDPYAWGWRDGNSRWDLIDFARAAHALRPDGVRWPAPDGVPSFKLGDLAAENDLPHAEPHAAPADVQATIALARLLKAAQPKLWRYALAHRPRDVARGLLTPLARKVCAHVSPSYANERDCAAPVVAVAQHPEIATRLIVADLSRDVEALIEEDAATLRERLFNTDPDRRDERPPLKAVLLNRCPFLAPIATVRAEDAARLGWDLDAVERRRQSLAGAGQDLAVKIAEVYGVDHAREPAADPELALYEGFLEDPDRRQADRVRQALATGAPWPAFAPRVIRLGVLGLRLKARLRRGELTDSERGMWDDHVRRCLRDGFGQRPSLAAFRADIAALRQSEQPRQDVEMLRQLAAYADATEAAAGL